MNKFTAGWLVVIAFVLGALLGSALNHKPRLKPGQSDSDATGDAVIVAPSKLSSVNHLRVRRVVRPDSITNYEPATSNENGLVVDPDEWVVTLDGATYYLIPTR